MGRIYKSGWCRRTKRFKDVHRIVMETYLGRDLRPSEQVHHRDRNPRNNLIENLELVSPKDHAARHPHKWYSDSELLESIRIAAVKVGRTPTVSEYKAAVSPTPWKTIINRFGGWNIALNEALGLSLRRRQLHRRSHLFVDPLDVLDDIKRVARKKRRMISSCEYEKEGRYCKFTVYSKFGSWSHVRQLLSSSENNFNV